LVKRSSKTIVALRYDADDSGDDVLIGAKIGQFTLKNKTEAKKIVRVLNRALDKFSDTTMFASIVKKSKK
jgi:hypothetical protein